MHADAAKAAIRADDSDQDWKGGPRAWVVEAPPRSETAGVSASQTTRCQDRWSATNGATTGVGAVEPACASTQSGQQGEWEAGEPAEPLSPCSPEGEQIGAKPKGSL